MVGLDGLARIFSGIRVVHIFISDLNTLPSVIRFTNRKFFVENYLENTLRTTPATTNPPTHRDTADERRFTDVILGGGYMNHER